MGPINAEAVFLEHLPWIERVAQSASRRFAFNAEDTEDFTASVMLRLMKDDYAVIRNFRGEASLRTYLTAVISRMIVEFRRERQGRWRPSAAAHRLGPTATHLEALLYRDGYPLGEAIEKLRTSDPSLPEERELIRLAAQLGERRPLRLEVAAGSELLELSDPTTPESGVEDQELDVASNRLTAALNDVLSSLNPEDSMIVRLYYAEGVSQSDIARILNIEHKPLYRRLEKLRVQIREKLEAAGITHDEVAAMIDRTP